jgi:acetyl esterase/lipase
MSNLLSAARAFAALTALSVSSAAFALPPLVRWKENCQCYQDVPWGDTIWYEKGIGRKLGQSLDFFPVSKDQQKVPLVIFAHPSGMTKGIHFGDDMWNKVVVPAITNGFAVASLEYRHPVDNDYLSPVPHEDVARATRWIREHAEQLGIDPRNIFYLSHSRGTLELWTALRYGNDPQVRVNAVYAYNAQATYQAEQTAEMFVIPEDRESFILDYNTEHPQHAQFGSALDEVSPGDPPLKLPYKDPFFGTLVDGDLVDVHHPDFGLAMCAAYLERNPKKHCETKAQVIEDNAYEGYIDFFKPYLKR